MSNIKKLACTFIATFGLSSIANAHLIDFDLTSDTNKNTYAMERQYTALDTELKVTGWSNALKTTKVCTKAKKDGTCKTWGTTTSVDEKIEQAAVGKWKSGVGVEESNSPNHAADNEGNDYDMLMLTFDKAISLTSIGLGWTKGDADVSLLAFTGKTSVSSLAGKTWKEVAQDWTHVGNYDRNGTGDFLVNPSGIISKNWIVGPFNPSFAHSPLSRGNDFIKLDGVKVNHPKVDVPEPSALLLLAMGLLSFGLIRRRAH